ncbi:MAG: T9SS type A sorting domain-containing protein, partial [Melioribacteraceae bacterium]|nr:T9SS type A sorting domain-containing protein [Melioribacteraceae bacterium]
ILELAFVFRSPDGSITGRDIGGGDIFVNLYDDDLTAEIIEPPADINFAEKNEKYIITVISKGAYEIELFVDQVSVKKTTNDTLYYGFKPVSPGKVKIKSVARDNNNNTVSDSLYYIVRGETVSQSLPDGLSHGINYIDDSTVTLVLYAPLKEFVYVIGDFSDWEPDPVYEMKLDDDRSTFWLTIEGLEKNKEYGFQYLIDEYLLIPDPYAEKVLDPWNDKYIPTSVYPDLKEYPIGKTTGIVSVFETGENDFVWSAQNYDRPEKENLVIYELLVRDFVSTHSYKTLIDTLDYFVKLGVNAIELMPVNEFEGNESWGYNPMMYFAPDKYYGTSQDLKAFIDAAHTKGIAVIMDIVLNHAYDLNPMVRMYFDDAGNRPSPDNPWFNIASPNTVYSWGYDFNHESQATKDFVDRVNKFWLTEYKFDGFRFDFTKGFTNTPGDGGRYDASRINILKRMADKIWEADPDAYIILEHFADNNEERELSNYGMMIWGNLNYNYNEATMGYNEGGKSNFSGISYKTRGWTNPNLVGYMESHDEERLMYKNMQYGNASDDYNIQDLYTAVNRIKLASAFFYTVPGPKMLWQFGELGYDYSIEYNGRVGNKPIRWDYYDDINRLNLYKTISALIYLKRNYDVFSTTDYSIDFTGPVKKINLNHGAMSATVVGNFDVVERSINPEFQFEGTWYDYFTAASVYVSDTQAPLVLMPGEFKIFTSKKLPAPEEGILTYISTPNNGIPGDFILHQNYPNPFNPVTNIIYSVAEISAVDIKIYDILGRQVVTLVNEIKLPGEYSVEFDGSKLSSGIYYYKLNAGSFTAVKKMMLIK